MFEKVISPYNPCQQTAFTSILVGVFLNSPLLPNDGLPGFTETAIATYYGQPFLDALDFYSNLPTMSQIGIMHKLQK